MKRTLPEDECRLISLQVARGLQHLHDMHVVHRDHVHVVRTFRREHNIQGEGIKAWLIDLGLAVDMDAQDAGGTAALRKLE
jgi:serine/threonine protein kinase